MREMTEVIKQPRKKLDKLILIKQETIDKLQEVLDKLAVARGIPEDERFDAEMYLLEVVLGDPDMLVQDIDPYNY
jgi:hypothetical protein